MIKIQYKQLKIKVILMILIDHQINILNLTLVSYLISAIVIYTPNKLFAIFLFVKI